MHRHPQGAGQRLPVAPPAKCSWLEIAERKQGAIKLAPLTPATEPRNLRKLKSQVQTRWGVVPLIDMVKEAVLRTGCLRGITSVADRGSMPEDVLAQRLLPAIYAYGTNTGIMSVSGGTGHTADEIRYARRRYLNAEAARRFAIKIANATFSARRSTIWGASRRPRSPPIQHISGPTTRTSSPSAIPATAAVAC
ncbi:Tn3 family transposase [Nocardia sp. CC201C]|uniref:Tn3 family transposase n=1 Tax=Nocardia sp. CC201C TaxID=3044575 RepID=UPI0024A93C01|nr:Tn3 family transposase [Nocardia sp. CC201C]